MSRLILVNRYFYPDESSTSQLLTDLARHLAGRHEVLVLTSRQLLADPRARLPAEGALGGVRIHRLWATSLGRGSLPARLLDYLSFMAAVALWLVCHVRRGDWVLAKTDPPLLGVVATLATLGRGVVRIQWFQDLYPEVAARLGVVADGGLVASLVRALRNWSLRHSEVGVTVSAGMREHVRGSAGSTHLVHIPNWADDYGELDSGLRGNGGGPDNGRLVVGYSGNLGRAHPIEGLMQLAELAPDPELEFLITGGGAHHERLRAHVERLGLRNWTFLPYQPREQLGAVLARADLHIVILDPRVEHFVFPSKLYGILSAGKPVLHLGDAAGEVGDLLREHGCGWSLPADSGTRILDLLKELRSQPDRLREAGRAARIAYENRYSRARALAQWDAVLTRLRAGERGDRQRV